jgi:hypothetical protein
MRLMINYIVAVGLIIVGAVLEMVDKEMLPYIGAILIMLCAIGLELVDIKNKL